MNLEDLKIRLDAWHADAVARGVDSISVPTLGPPERLAVTLGLVVYWVLVGDDGISVEAEDHGDPRVAGRFSRVDETAKFVEAVAGDVLRDWLRQPSVRNRLHELGVHPDVEVEETERYSCVLRLRADPDVWCWLPSRIEAPWVSQVMSRSLDDLWAEMHSGLPPISPPKRELLK